MAQITAPAAVAISSNWFFPGIRGGSFAVLSATAEEYRIQYAMDGLSGQGLVVTFIPGATFSYSGGAPTSGDIAAIRLSKVVSGLETQIGYLTVNLNDPYEIDNAVSIASFGSANLPALLTDQLTQYGSSKNDTLYSYDVGTFFRGGGGSDTFILTRSNSNYSLQGGDGPGVDGTNTVILRAGGSINASTFTDIDKIDFDGKKDTVFDVRIERSGIVGPFAVDGDAFRNTLKINSIFAGGATDDYSAITFTNWSTTGDSVVIDVSYGVAKAVGTIQSDRIIGEDATTSMVGLAGNDVLVFEEGVDVVAAHGSAADGTGGASETDLIGVNADLDLTSATLTNIDGFEIVASSGIFFSFDSLQINVADFGAGIRKDAIFAGAVGSPKFVDIVLVGSTSAFDASLWKVSNLDHGVVSISLSAGNSTYKGWKFADSVRLNGGSATVSTGASFDSVSFDHKATGGALDGGADSDSLSIDWTGSTKGLVFTLLDPSKTTAGPNGMTIKGFEDLSFEGSEFGDTVVAGSEASFLRGYGGDDSLTGGAGDDQIFGGKGNDTLKDSVGQDYLLGEDGDDAIFAAFASGRTKFDGGIGTDFLSIDRSGLKGSIVFDLLDAEQQSSGIELSDLTVIAGFESFSFLAGSGNDTIAGGNLADTISGGSGRDLLSGREGKDILNGGAGLDILDGGDDADTIDGGDGADLIDGGDGDDDLRGGKGDDTIDGGLGRDRLFGDDGNDRLSGGDGDDTLSGGAGADSFDGADGFDTADFSGTTAVRVDRTNALGGTGAAYGDVFISIEKFLLSSGNDKFVGNTDDETIVGGAGIDTVTGGGGSDTVSYEGSTSGVTVNLKAATASGGDAQGDILSGISNLIGSDKADSLTGTDGANVLDGRLGADTARGGLGNDTYRVDNAGDIVIEGLTEGTADIVLSSVSYTLGTGVHVEILATADAAGTTALTLNGNDQKQTITGNAGANTLRGYGGDDTINAGGGDDKISGGTGNDTLTGNAGADTYFFSYALNASTNVDTIKGFSSIDLISLSASIFTKAGPAGALAAGVFIANVDGKAGDATDRIVYETDTGILRYDPDGTGAAAAVAFAIMDGKPAMNAGDFVIA